MTTPNFMKNVHLMYLTSRKVPSQPPAVPERPTLHFILPTRDDPHIALERGPYYIVFVPSIDGENRKIFMGLLRNTADL